MFRNMVTSLFEHGQVKTTDAKAKELRRWADNMITLAKRGDLHARRQALSVIRKKSVVHELFEAADERFGSIAGGYTRITKIGFRKGDAAPISLVDFVGDDEVDVSEKKTGWLARFTGRGKEEAAKKAAAAEAAKEAEEKKEAEAAEAAEPEVEESAAEEAPAEEAAEEAPEAEEAAEEEPEAEEAEEPAEEEKPAD